MLCGCYGTELEHYSTSLSEHFPTVAFHELDTSFRAVTGSWRLWL